MREIIFILLLLVLLLVSCSDKNSETDVEISKLPADLLDDVTETWKIYSYNSFRCMNQSTMKNEDGSYTITFVFEKMKADYRLPGEY